MLSQKALAKSCLLSARRKKRSAFVGRMTMFYWLHARRSDMKHLLSFGHAVAVQDHDVQGRPSMSGSMSVSTYVLPGHESVQRHVFSKHLHQDVELDCDKGSKKEIERRDKYRASVIWIFIYLRFQDTFYTRGQDAVH